MSDGILRAQRLPEKRFRVFCHYNFPGWKFPMVSNIYGIDQNAVIRRIAARWPSAVIDHVEELFVYKEGGK